MPLTPKQQRFVEEYLIDLNGLQAAIRAGYSRRTAGSIASRLLKDVNVSKAIKQARDEQAYRAQVESDEVLRNWTELGRADPNELIEIRRTCCRHCHGVDHRHQWTERELERAREEWERLRAKLAKDNQPAPAPLDERGGIGFDPRREPHPDCPECFGEGVREVFVKDTRALSPNGRRLYAGAKVTKDGIEIKTRDQDAAWLNIAKHFGMLVDKHEVTGKDGADLFPVKEVIVEHHKPADSAGFAAPEQPTPGES